MLPHNKRRFWCLPLLVNFWIVFLQHCMADGKAKVAVPRVRSHPENEKVDLWSSPISSDATDLYNVYLRSSFLDTLSPFSTHQVTFYQSSNSNDLSFEVEKVREMAASSRFSTSVIGVHDFGTSTNSDIKNSVFNHRDEEQTRYSQVERQVSFHHLDNFQFSSTFSIPWALKTIICLTCEQSRTFNSETIVGSRQEASFQVLRNNLYGSVAFSSSDSMRLNLETKYEFQIQSTSEIAYLADGSPVLSNVLSSNISDLLKATLSISPSPVDVGRFKTFEVSKGLVNELSSSNIVNLYTFNLPNETCRFSHIGSLTFVNLSPRLPHLTSCISDKDVEIKRPTLPINEESTQFTSSKRINVFTEDIFLMPHRSESVLSYSSAIYSSEVSDNGETVAKASHIFHTEQISDTVVEISSDTFWRATYSRNLISDEDKYILSPEQSSKRLAVSTGLPAEIFTTNNVEANSARTKFPKQMISSSFIPSSDFSNHLHVWFNTAFIQQTLSVSLSELENHTYFSSQPTIIRTFSTPIDTDELAVSSLFILQLNSTIQPDVPVENSTIIHSNVLVRYNTTSRSTMSRQRNTIIHYNIPRQHNNTVLSNVLIQDDSSIIPNYSVRYKSKTYLNITKQLDAITEVNVPAHVSTEVDSAIESDIAMYVNRTAMFYIPTESDILTKIDIPTEHSSIRESNFSIQHDVSMELDNLTAYNVSPDTVNPKGLPVPLKPDNPAGFNNVTISGILTRHDNPKEIDKSIDHDTVAHSDSSTSLNVPTRPDNPTELENLGVSDISTQFYIQIKYDTALESNTPVELRTSVAFDIPTFDDNSKESHILAYPDIRANLIDPQNIAPVGVHKVIDDLESHTFKFYNPNDTTKNNYSVLNLLPNEQFISKTVNKYFTADENENTIEDYGINPHLRISSIVAVKPTKVYRDFQEMPSLSLEQSSSSDPGSRSYILESSSTAISKFNLNFFISADITQNLIWNKLSSNVVPVKASLYAADDIHSHESTKTRSSGYSKQEEATIKQTDTLISTIFQSTYTLKSTDIPWHSAQASEAHLTRNENKMDDETTTFEETLSSTSKFHAFDETTSVWNIDKATIFPSSSETEVYSQVPFIPFYISLAMLMSWARFCSVKETLRREIAWILSSVLNEPILPGQVCFKNAQEQCEAVIHRNNEEDITKSKSIDVFVYMNDKNGKYDLVLTRRSAHVLQQEAGKSNTLVYHSSVHRVDTYLQERHFKRPTPHTTSGVIATVTISCIGGACLLLLCILLVVMKQRLDQPRNCSLTYDSYSLESFSTTSSFQRRRGRRSSLCSFVNQAFQDSDGLSHPLDTSSLAVFASNMEAINQEFKKIPMNMPRVDEALPGTEVKNRYANIIPVPETRVFLKPHPGEPHSDYINANYVRGYDGKSNAYIATQGPLLETISSFWQMVWEQKCQVIIMLTQLSEKGMPRCAPYFPSKLMDCDRSYGQYQVSLKKKEIDESYTISMFCLRRTDLNECRDITHFWYTNWPVYGVPNDVYKVISFLLEARVYMNSSSSPTVVHCSPGTGRTGVIIALDSCIRQYEESQTVDVARSVYKLRRDRGGAVQNMEQYVFIYQALREYVCNILHETYNPTVVCSS